MSCAKAPPPGLYCASETAAAVDGWHSIDSIQLSNFHRHGFLVVKNAIARHELDDAVQAIDELLSGANPEYKPSSWGDSQGVLLRPGKSLESVSTDRLEALVLARALVDHDVRLSSIASNSGLITFLRTVMHDDPVLVHNMVRSKPTSIGDKPWHQDMTHFNIHHSSLVVTAWLAIDDAPIEAGSLHFLPKSHLKGPAKHVFDRDYQIADDEVSRIGQVAAPVERGSFILFNALVHHGSPPNTGNDRRLALQMTFKQANAKMISSEERIDAFGGSARNG